MSQITSLLHPADMIIVAVLALSLILGFSRGFIREAFSLAGWVAAVLVARWFNEPLAAYLADSVSTPSVRLVISWGGLFFGTLLIFSLLGQALRLMASATGLSLFDRMLGGLFGVARGALLVLIALMLMAPYVKHDAWFSNAQLPRAFLNYESLVRSLQRETVQLLHADKPDVSKDIRKAGKAVQHL